VDIHCIEKTNKLKYILMTNCMKRRQCGRTHGTRTQQKEEQTALCRLHLMNSKTIINTTKQRDTHIAIDHLDTTLTCSSHSSSSSCFHCHCYSFSCHFWSLCRSSPSSSTQHHCHCRLSWTHHSPLSSSTTPTLS